MWGSYLPRIIGDAPEAIALPGVLLSHITESKPGPCLDFAEQKVAEAKVAAGR